VMTRFRWWLSALLSRLAEAVEPVSEVGDFSEIVQAALRDNPEMLSNIAENNALFRRISDKP
jgi:hypothetical protein